MKRIIIITLLLAAAINAHSRNYDFSAVCSTGQTLYYNITSDSTVSVTYPSYYNYGTTSSYYHNRTKPVGSIMIPDTVTHNWVVYRVTAIGPYAFYECAGIDSIFFNNHIVSIGECAFLGCTGLHRVVIPDGIHAIYSSTFLGCTNINEIRIGSGVDTIGWYAFAGCSSIHRLFIPDNVSYIGGNAFEGCSGIDSLYLGVGIKTMGGESLKGCNNISYVFYNIKNGPGGILSYRNIYWPSENPYTGIPLYNTDVFLTKLEIGDSVDTIPDYAFFDRGIGTVIISDSVKYIGNSAFRRSADGYQIGSFIIGDGISSIGSNAFKNCVSLQQLNLSNIHHIGDSAFYNCTNIQNIHLCDDLVTLGNSTFYNCSSIHSIIIPDNVDSIGEYTFYGCSNVDSIYLGTNLRTIGRESFGGCSNLKYMHYNAKNLQQPLFDVWGCNQNGCGWNRGTTYGSNVPFLGMDPANFRYLVIGDSVENVPDGCFGRASAIDTVVFNATNCYQLDARGVFYSSSIPTFVIGDSVKRYPDYIFNRNTNHFDSIPWRDSLRYIGKDCFSGYNSIVGNFVIPSYVDSIVGAFSNCDSILTLTSNARFISDGAFANCDRLVTITLGDSVQTIGNGTFRGCFRLMTCTMGDGVRTIGSSTFSGCNRMSDFNIGSGVTNIGDSAFYGCSLIHDIVLPEGLNTIGNHAFSGCSAISGRLIFPSTITSIGDYAFRNNDTITELRMKGSNPPTIYAHTFASVSNTTPVSIPCGALMNYYISDYWDDFQNLAEAPPIELNVESVNLVMGSAIVVQHPSCTSNTAIIQAVANDNYHFLYWSDGNGSNPRQIQVTQDTTFTAIFVMNNSYIDVMSSNPAMGYVSGGGSYEYLQTATLTATAFSGYHFIRWNDGNTQNPRPVTVTQDSSFTAYFVSNICNISAVSANTVMGSTAGSGVYNYQNTIVLLATPNYGYHFTGWNDGITENPRNVYVVQDSTFTAYFDVNYYAINVSSNSQTMGSVTGTGNYAYLNEMQMEATPAYGYHFEQWNDQNTNNPRTITVTRDSAFTAQFAANSYTITAEANDPTMGSAYGSGTYNFNTTVTLTAVETYGYHFTQWSDGVTDNPRTITVQNSATYTAQFEINSYIITVQSSDPAIGTASGGGSFNYLTPVYITANPNPGYHFTQWSDGNTDNPRLISVIQNATYTAQFAINSYEVVVNANDSSMGNVSGSGTYYHNMPATITATPNYGHHFVMWSDGSLLNPRTITVTNDFAVTAMFAANQYSFSCTSNNNTMGNVSLSGGNYDYQTSLSVEAIPNYGYHFVSWNDGVTVNPRSIVITQDTALQAIFAINQYLLNVGVNEASMGSVNGMGSYDYLSQVTISANAATHHHFVQWNDGNTTNPRLVVLTRDTSFTAIFEQEPQFQITVNTNDATMGSVEGGGMYYLGETTTITATANEHYYFAQWSDGMTSNPRVITVTGDMAYTAVFEPVMYTLTVSANDYSMGQVTGGGSYAYGTEVTIEARAFGGYSFNGWSDGVMDEQRRVTVTEDATYTAFFGTVGIDDVDGVVYKVYVSDGRIVVEGVEGKRVQIFDIAGREHRNDEQLPMGVYMVRIDGVGTKKVVVR